MKRISMLLSLFLIFVAACERTNYNDEILKFYGDAKEDIGNSIAIADEGYYICGQFTEITRNDNSRITGTSKRLCIIKTGFDGNVIWQKTFGELEGSGTKIIVTDDGSVICVGQVTDTVTKETDLFVVKVNSDGSDVVEEIYKASGNQAGCDILQTQEGFIILATTDAERIADDQNAGNLANKKDILLVRIKSNLEQIAVQPWGYPNNDAGVSIKPDFDGGYIVAGTTDKPESGKSNNNIFLIRFNQVGSPIEPLILVENDDEYAADLEVLEDGYLVAGTIGQSNVSQSVYIQKIPKNFKETPLPARRINNDASWSVNAMSRYKTNAFVLAGKSGGTSGEMLVFAVDEEGNKLTGKEMILGGTGIQVANDVVSDSEGYIIAVGKNNYENDSLISFYKFKF